MYDEMKLKLVFISKIRRKLRSLLSVKENTKINGYRK